MKKLDAFICGIASISLTVPTHSDVIKRFPSSYEKDINKSLQKSWTNVVNALKGALDEFK